MHFSAPVPIVTSSESKNLINWLGHTQPTLILGGLHQRSLRKFNCASATLCEIPPHKFLYSENKQEIYCNLIGYHFITLVHYEQPWRSFISMKGCRTYKHRVKNSKFKSPSHFPMPSSRPDETLWGASFCLQALSLTPPAKKNAGKQSVSFKVLVASIVNN